MPEAAPQATSSSILDSARPRHLHWNLGTAALYEQAVRDGEGVVAETGPRWSA